MKSQLALSLLLATGAWGQGDFAPLSRALEAELKQTGNPGAVVALVQEGRLLHVEVMGVASLDSREPLGQDAVFRAGSISKVVTAVAAMHLMEQRKLDLDAPIGRYVQGLGSRVSRLTMRQLLSHTGGVRADIAAVPKTDELDDARLRARLLAEGDSLLFTEPSTIFSYSNLGFDLAGLVLEAITGQPYAEAIHRLVLEPAGMKSSTFRPLMAMTFPLAQGHDEDDRHILHVVRPVRMDTLYSPSSFLFASAPDLARLALSLMSSSALAHMAVPVVALPVDSPGRRSQWGMGLDIETTGGVRKYSHGGRMLGHTSHWEIDPERRLAVVILTNAFDSPLPKTRAAAWEALGAKLPALPPEPAPEPVPPAEAKALVGSYANGSLRMEVFERGGKLLLREPAQGVIRGEMEIRRTGPSGYICLPLFAKLSAPLVIVPPTASSPGFFWLGIRALVKEGQ